jgi:5-methylcytosine-specific restriction endonuclease McrA
MKFELEPYQGEVSEDDIIIDLKNVARRLVKNSVTQREYNEHGKYSHKTVYKKFGSWPNALKKADLELKSNIGSKISDDALFQNLQDVWINLEQQPKYKDMVLPLSKYHSSTYERRFYGWRKALIAFIDYIDQDDNEQKIYSVQSPVVKNRTQRTPNLRLRFKVLKRDNFKCRKCGRSPANYPNITLEVDHITPWSKEGETVEENLQTLCNECNQGKSNLFSI